VGQLDKATEQNSPESAALVGVFHQKRRLGLIRFCAVVPRHGNDNIRP
jgi:hypothetical protein